MWLRVFLLFAGLAGSGASFAFAAPNAAEQARAKWQYEDVARCKATYALTSNNADRRSQRAIAGIDAKIKQLAQGKSPEQVLNDIALQSATLTKLYGKPEFIESGWRRCLSRYAPYGLNDDPALAKMLLPHAPQEDRLAAARTILSAPEKHSSLHLVMAGEPLLRAGQKDDARFLFHAGGLRISHLGIFLETQADQDMIQGLNWVRRAAGLAFLTDGLGAAHESRIAVERVVAWDRATPNLELADALSEADDRAAVERKMEANRCNYLIPHYFSEAAVMLEVRERYDGDVERFSKDILDDLSHVNIMSSRTDGNTPTARLTARQKALVDSAKQAIIKASFGGDKLAYVASAKSDPVAACELLLAEAKKLVH